MTTEVKEALPKYRFNKEKHLHQLLVDGEYKNLTGCTTILSVLAKPALIPWAAKMAVESIRQQIEDIVVESERTKSQAWDYLEKNLDKMLEVAKSAHAKRKTDSGAFGTKTHETIEQIINTAIEHNGGYIRETNGFAIEHQAIQNFLGWAVKNKVKFLETEKNVYSEFLFIGGIVDFVCEIDGQVWIGDIKTTGSGIYPEHFFQCAGYDLMMGEMGLYPNITGYLILNLKENGEILEKRSVSNDENKQIFRNCLEIYRVQEKLKNQII